MAARSRKPKGEVAAATKAAKEDSQRSVMDIPSLQQFLELIGSFSPDLIHHRGSVKSIYHCTDSNGLKGIVEKNDLWLTNSRNYNDGEEMIHGLAIKDLAGLYMQSRVGVGAGARPALDRPCNGIPARWSKLVQRGYRDRILHNSGGAFPSS